MQLKTLLKKEILSLFRQKAIVATLLIPLFFIASFGLLPTLLGVEGPFKVSYFNEDEGIDGLNLGESIIDEMGVIFEESDNIEIVEVNSHEEFMKKSNGFWLPLNFTYLANLTNNATYYLKMSDTNIRANSIMNGIKLLIETVVNEELLYPQIPPNVEPERLYEDSDLYGSEERKRRSDIAFSLAYLAFLILILASSSMRIASFSAEKHAGMMEILMSSVRYRRDLILSKLITGVIYGLLSVLSYMIGIIVVFVFENEEATEGTEFTALVLPEDAVTFTNVMIIIILFTILTFLSMQIILASQLALGKEAGDRAGSMINMALAFIFYFGSVGNPLNESTIQVVNPFFWPFKVALNLIFRDSFGSTLIYCILMFLFSVLLLTIKIMAIEREKTLYE